MPYCSAVGCNSKHGMGKGFFLFPKDQARRRAWTIRVSKKDFRPTKYSVLCSDHFEPQCFETPPSVYESLGLKRNLRLKEDAIPSIFTHRQPKEATKRRILQKADSSQKKTAKKCAKKVSKFMVVNS